MEMRRLALIQRLIHSIKLGIGFKLTLGTVLLVLVAGGLMSFVSERMLEEQAVGEIRRYALGVGRSVGVEVNMALRHNEREDLLEYMRALVEGDWTTRYIVITDVRGKVLAEAGSRDGRSVSPERLLEVVVPVLGQPGIQVRVGADVFPVYEQMARVRWWHLTSTGSILVVALIGCWGLVRHLVNPLAELLRATRRFASGDFAHRVQVRTQDEIGSLGAAFNEMVEKMERLISMLRASERSRRILLRKVISAQEDERKAVARELHDEVGQKLTSLALQARVLEESGPSGEVRRRAADLRALAHAMLGEIQGLCRRLRPGVLDDLGLGAALERYAREFSDRHGIDVDVCVTGLDGARLPSEIEVAVYRIVQEALTNVARHSGSSWASVVVQKQGGYLVAVIEDGGKGMSIETICGPGGVLPECCMGLFGMQERARLLGGDVTFETTRSEGGLTVVAKIPLPAGDLEIEACASCGPTDAAAARHSASCTGCPA